MGIISKKRPLTRETLQCRDKELKDAAHTVDIRDQTGGDESSTNIYSC